jgi:hypothetical protein
VDSFEFLWKTSQKYAFAGAPAVFLPLRRVFQRRNPAFHRSFQNALDNQILPVCPVESFQSGFPQVVENLCGFAEKYRSFCRKSLFFPFFYRNPPQIRRFLT